MEPFYYVVMETGDISSFCSFSYVQLSPKSCGLKSHFSFSVPNQLDKLGHQESIGCGLNCWLRLPTFPLSSSPLPLRSDHHNPWLPLWSLPYPPWCSHHPSLLPIQCAVKIECKVACTPTTDLICVNIHSRNETKYYPNFLTTIFHLHHQLTHSPSLTHSLTHSLSLVIHMKSYCYQPWLFIRHVSYPAAIAEMTLLSRWHSLLCCFFISHLRFLFLVMLVSYQCKWCSFFGSTNHFLTIIISTTNNLLWSERV